MAVDKALYAASHSPNRFCEVLHEHCIPWHPHASVRRCPNWKNGACRCEPEAYQLLALQDLCTVLGVSNDSDDRDILCESVRKHYLEMSKSRFRIACEGSASAVIMLAGGSLVTVTMLILAQQVASLNPSVKGYPLHPATQSAYGGLIAVVMATAYAALRSIQQAWHLMFGGRSRAAEKKEILDSVTIMYNQMRARKEPNRKKAASTRKKAVATERGTNKTKTKTKTKTPATKTKKVPVAKRGGVHARTRSRTATASVSHRPSA